MLDSELTLKQFETRGWLSNPRYELLPEFAAILPSGRTPSVLDVGSGPVSRVGYRLECEPLDFTCIDVAADFYRSRFSPANIPAQIIPKQADISDIGKIFDRTFDVVVIWNALDEVEDPATAVETMLAACNPGGYSCIYNFIDRATKQPNRQDIRWKFGLDADRPILSRGNRIVDLSAVAGDRYWVTQLNNDFLKLRIRKPGANDGEVARGWDQGKAETTHFWRSVINAKPGDQYFDQWKRRLDQSSPFDRSVLDAFGPSSKKTIRVLDVGAGPCTHLGYTVPGKQIKITAVDYYAELFQSLLDEASVEVPVKTAFGDAERLTKLLRRNSFDIAHSRNALDHVKDPVRALTEMLDLTRRGGIVFVSGHINEAEREFYHGFHQWNFLPEDGDLIIWRPEQRFSVKEKLGPRVSAMSATKKNNSYTLVLRKV